MEHLQCEWRQKPWLRGLAWSGVLLSVDAHFALGPAHRFQHFRRYSTRCACCRWSDSRDSRER